MYPFRDKIFSFKEMIAKISDFRGPAIEDAPLNLDFDNTYIQRLYIHMLEMFSP